ncbi:MAG: histidinol dehydrogenase [Anaerohalosphaeraceae bacterium]|nr:histidinol dehydrogenase [Anaerohalosphaeraceae bacterium]
MNSELKNIIISHKNAGFHKKLRTLRTKVINASQLSEENLAVMRKIVADVRCNGERAVAQYTEKFDGVELTPEQFRVSAEDLKKAHSQIDKELLAAIKKSLANVKRYQTEIFAGKNKICSNGTGVKYTPIEKVGVCVPGASAPLPSTVIMTVVPAQVAGVKKISVISPPRHNGSIHPAILAVCYELGLENIYRIGGVQGVAALAYGTPSIENVDMIVGPGNQWVQAAKREVFGKVGIDSIAGPSEVLIIAGDTANADFVAADMLSQAEHAPGSAVLFTTSQELGEAVLVELQKQLLLIDKTGETFKCLESYGRIVVFENMDQAIQEADNFAAEHLQVVCGDKSREIAEKIKNAGAIFIGPYTPVATGDYFAGPSHTLPTGTSARFSSPLSSNDFVKSTSVIEYTEKMLKAASDDIIKLAKTEGLTAHANSVKIRTGN